ncbi:MAG: type VI secretion system contractile sheath small subunit [Acidobacteriia bacterium]|nr:type VI secretion system contractile sheath small subunit [Terriglobia bacterium]
MSESTQHKLDRIRPPRVQITYDVETGGSIQKKELPFAVGILADLSGKPETALPKLKDRKFVEIDRDNFNDILKAIGPRLVLRVDNKLAEHGSKLNVELRFRHMEDFTPLAMVKQVKPLNALLEARGRLNDLLAKLDGNDDLDATLQWIARDVEGLKRIKAAAQEQAAETLNGEQNG